MARTIWKYGLEVTDRQVIEMPIGGQPVAVAAQGHDVALWALVDPDAIPVPVGVQIFGTGHPIPDAGLTYVGTVQDPTLPLVWHVFTEEG